jgi:hypothetical protein
MTLAEVDDSARSIPLVRQLWDARLAGLRSILTLLDAATDPANFKSQSWHDLNRALGELTAVRNELLAMLIALAPFDTRDISSPDRRDHHRDSGKYGAALLSECDAVVDAVLDGIERGEIHVLADRRLSALTPGTPSVALPSAAEALAVTFAMDTVPVDADGAFSAAKVFEAFKYENERLLAYLLTHMRSLGVEPIDDMLAMVSICGWIASAPDPVLAWQSFRSLTLRLRFASQQLQPSPLEEADSSELDGHAGKSVVNDVLLHLTRREEALRQGRRLVQARFKEFLSTDDTELGAHALADAYRRLLEGPVREYGWSMRRLVIGTWEPTPTVGMLSEAFGADGWLAPAINPILFPDVRNGQAHEALEWDGRRQVFMANGTDVELQRVDVAVANAMSFALGCEAALAHWRGTQVVVGAMAPAPNEPGRMAPWRRAEALFGTNGLRLISFRHNAAHADLRLERLHRQDINPTFQALVHARRLLPGVETFSVYADESTGSSDPRLTVTAAALEATYPVWVKAREAFDAMPLAAFLPANLNARLVDEPEQVAATAVSWIALDDALSAIDEQPLRWTTENQWLAKTRIDVARFALQQCEGALANPRHLVEVRQLLDRLFDDLSSLVGRIDAREIDDLASVVHLREQWTSLGPVARLPRITSERDDQSHGYSRHAGRRTSTPFDRFTTM